MEKTIEKNKLLLFLLAIIASFIWYELRPTIIRSYCYRYSIDSAPDYSYESDPHTRAQKQGWWIDATFKYYLLPY